MIKGSGLQRLVPLADVAISLCLALSWVGLLWQSPYAVSMDSPSHLYTSHVAAELLLRPDSHYSTFYEFNGTYLPNCKVALFRAIAIELNRESIEVIQPGAIVPKNFAPVVLSQSIDF